MAYAENQHLAESRFYLNKQNEMRFVNLKIYTNHFKGTG